MFSIRIKIQLGRVGIIYPTAHYGFKFHPGRSGIIQIGRLWVDW